MTSREPGSCSLALAAIRLPHAPISRDDHHPTSDGAE